MLQLSNKDGRNYADKTRDTVLHTVASSEPLTTWHPLPANPPQVTAPECLDECQDRQRY